MLPASRYRALNTKTGDISFTDVRYTSAHITHTQCSVCHCRPNIFLPSRPNCAPSPSDVYPGASLWKPHQCRPVARTWVRPRRHERGVVHRHFPWTTKPSTLKSNVRNMQIILIINSLSVRSSPFETTQVPPPT